jgi:hypothetical protein
MYDTRVYRHFLTRGGAQPDVRTALGQRLHDAGIDDALTDTLDGWRDRGGTAPGPVVGVMGGHAVRRGDPTFRMAAELGRELARPLLSGSPRGDLTRTVHLTDDISEAVELLTRR